MAIKNTPASYRKRDENWGKVPCRIETCEETAGVAGLCQNHRRNASEFIKYRRTIKRGVTVADMIEILSAFDGDAELNKLRIDKPGEKILIGLGAVEEEFQMVEVDL